MMFEGRTTNDRPVVIALRYVTAAELNEAERRVTVNLSSGGLVPLIYPTPEQTIDAYSTIVASMSRI